MTKILKALKNSRFKSQSNRFKCLHCSRLVPVNKFMGTDYRNHCPFCLWSKHVDLETPGDRLSSCQGRMRPIALTTKHEGWDKWSKSKRGELMIVQYCLSCGKVSINRVASDDNPDTIFELFEQSKNLENQICIQLADQDIQILAEKDKEEVVNQLFGIVT